MPMRMICADQTLLDAPGKLEPGRSYRLGRSSRCEFVVEELSVSRVHAEVMVDGDAMCVKDLDSRNGTFVDGKRVNDATLRPGQTVSFGAALFHVVGNLQWPSDNDMSAISTHIMRGNGRPQLGPEPVRPLTDAQHRVLELLLIGFSDKQVVKKLHISIHTVRNHIKRIHRRFGVVSRAELLAAFISESRLP